MNKKHLGQYFTTNKHLLHHVRSFVRNRDGIILEPSRGAGHIVQYLMQHGENRPWVTVEIDRDVETIPEVDEMDNITHIWDDFLLHEFDGAQFSTIVGNPPYVKQKGKMNMYLLFLEKCMSLMREHSEMIMVIPTDFMFATSGRNVRTRMMEEGKITDIYRPDSETLFEGASQDVIVIRYVRGTRTNACSKNNNTVKYNGETKTLTLTQNGVLSCLDHSDKNAKTVGDFFYVKVGMVSGADNIFRNEQLGNVPFVSRNGEILQYIFTRTFPSGDADIDAYLLQHKHKLMERRIRKFHDDNWFEWGAVRNYEFMQPSDAQCIYMETLTRKKEIAFLGTKMHFDGNLLCLAPKQEMSDTELQSWVEYFNSSKFQNEYIQSGRFKIGQNILCSANALS